MERKVGTVLTSSGALLLQYRLDAALTQKELADLIGVDGSYIARIEMNQRRASRKLMLKIGKALRLSSAQLDLLLVSALHLPEGNLDELFQSPDFSLIRPLFMTIGSVLADEDLSPAARQKFGEEISAYVIFRHEQLKQAEATRPKRGRKHK